MVRVLSVHNFESQAIETCEDPVAVTTAPPDRLLVALNHHMIEVHDLTPERKPVFSFPTVDQVSSLMHCVTGNYVATMEIKVSRDNREVVYTRVYANWDQPELLSSSQPTAMRARIAGRVTPSSSQTGGETLEMIELPVRFPNTNAIACCQATGNIIVSAGKTLCLFQLVSRLHDISRLRFLDFELWPVTLELNFAPTHLSIVENIVAAMDTLSQSVHVFKINKGVSHRSGQSSTYSGSPLRTNSTASASGSDKRCIPSDQDPVDMDHIINRGDWSSINSQSCLQVVELPTVKMNNLSCDLRPSPFKPTYMVSMGVAIKEMPTNEPWAEQMTTMVESLLQLEIEDCNQDKLHTLILRPLYQRATNDENLDCNTASNNPTDWSCPRLRSLNYNRLPGIDCLICTQQEGFLYHFTVGSFDTVRVNVGECLTVYNFTSPLKHICMEAGLLHALTSSGLETYTMRSTHAVHLDDNYVCPPLEDPVCLIGLRPFIGVVGLLLTEFHLVILASSEVKFPSWTIYSLTLPSSEQLYHDMVSVASTYKESNPLMYRQLLGEAHIIVRTAAQLISAPTSSVTVSAKTKEMFQQSCTLLSQTYLVSDKETDWEIGSRYVAMSGMRPDEYLSWLSTSEKQTNFNMKLMLGMPYYLMSCLGHWHDRLPQSVMNALADHLEPVQLAQLLLKSPAIVSCASDNIRQRLLKRTETECCLALELLARDPGKALKLLPNDKETDSKMVKILLEHNELLFDTMRLQNNQTIDDEKMKMMTFSELSVLLMQEKPYQLALCLAHLVTETNKFDLDHILQIFMTYLPSRIGLAGASASGGVVLQMFLEEVLVFCNEKTDVTQPSVQDALKILMRSYLSDTKCRCIKECNIEKLPLSELPKFLYELPSNTQESNPSTRKLQWLLYKGWLDTSALSELNQFVYDFLPDCLTLQVLAQPPEAAIELLINNAPSALVQYAKEIIKDNSDWQALLKQLKSRTDKGVKDDICADLLKELLTWLSENGRLCNILPPDEVVEEYKDYILTCQQVRHADHIHCLIRATGEHLLTTLNL